MSDYPQSIVPVDHVEPVPRRLRAFLGGEPVLDTTRARYVWEWSFYPQYYIPIADTNRSLLVDEQRAESSRRGTARLHGLRVGETHRGSCARVYGDDALAGLADTVRFDWAAMDSWFEEDEEVFVHPRNPYARVDALRSTRNVRVEFDGVVLAESTSPVLVFETGLPTRYYLNRTDVNFRHLVPSGTTTSCPYKGRTSGYWSVRVNDTIHPDLAWSYSFPTGQPSADRRTDRLYNERLTSSSTGSGSPDQGPISPSQRGRSTRSRCRGQGRPVRQRGGS